MEASGDSMKQKLSGVDGGEKTGLPKMGRGRKAFFLLSVNGWVLYLAVLLYFIPCRHPSCRAFGNWTSRWDGELTTNLEATRGSSNLVFGFSDELGGHLASLATSDGALAWNRNTTGVLRNVFCDFHKKLEMSDSAVPVCIGTAYNYVEAFSISGDTLWQTELRDPYDETIHRVALSSDFDSGASILGVGDEYLFVFDSKNGTILSTIGLPCSWTIAVKLVGPWTHWNGSQWTLVCDFGDSLEVWNFEEGEVLQPPPGTALKKRSDVRFELLISVGGGGAIDLAGDVTRRGESLALSFADRVVMATRQAPSSRLGKKWERRFPDLLVTSMSFGHFTDSKKVELAVMLKGERNAEMHILEVTNGTSKYIKPLGPRNVMSVYTLVAEKNHPDALILESISQESNFTEIMPRREYFVLKFEMSKNEFYQENIASANAYASTVSPLCEGACNLLIASRGTKGGTEVSRYVVTNGKNRPSCSQDTVHVVD